MKIGILIMLLSFNLFAATKSISFEQDGKKFVGDFSSPDKAKGKLPLVIIVHEWWGKTEYPKMRAEKLNKEGLATLVVDLYGDNQIAEDPKKAGELAGAFYKDAQLGVSRLQKYLDLVAKETNVDSSKIYAIGYCFGGTQVLNLARSGANLKGVVSFHGGLAAGLVAKKINSTILVLHGEADPLVPAKEVAAFKEEMKNLHVQLKFVSYPGALHAFTNPKATEVGKKYNMPVAYDEKADKDSWAQLLSFVK